MIEEREVSFQFKAPYYTRNNYTAQTKRIWLAFHGYGQLTRYFIRKFDQLDPQENFIIAPQGLNKAYLEGFSGRVGANWMTKENRLVDIQNQYTYISAVLQHTGVDLSDKELIYFGFSQGVATMSRFAAHARLPFSKMIFWAGGFPPELESNHFNFLNGSEKFSYYTGLQDPFLEPGMMDDMKQRISAVMSKKPDLITFEGKHEMIPELIGKI